MRNVAWAMCFFMMLGLALGQIVSLGGMIDGHKSVCFARRPGELCPYFEKRSAARVSSLRNQGVTAISGH